MKQTWRSRMLDASELAHWRCFVTVTNAHTRQLSLLDAHRLLCGPLAVTVMTIGTRDAPGAPVRRP